MSDFRRSLLMMITLDDSIPIVSDFTDGVVTLNTDGYGRRISVSGGEVTIND